ncbi:MAG: GLUG motif-containing protein [Planctomycetota bacterium]
MSHENIIHNRSSKLIIALLTCIAFCLLASPARAQYGGGKGEPDNPHLISEPWHMNAIGANPDDWGDHFKLTNDIDLGDYTGTSFNIIGSGWNAPFTGTFDGNGFRILNFTYGPTSTDDYKAIFGMVNAPDAEIKNLGLIGPDVTGGDNHSAALVARLVDGAISNCYVEDGSVSGGDFTGGLVADISWYGIMIKCHAATSVSGNWAVGGLVGINNGILTNCYAAGGVYGDNEIGGLVGRNEQDNGTISDCYSSGNVEGNTDVGGLVGCNNGGTILSCYAVGDATGNSGYAGGFIGANNGYSANQGIISNCYAIGDVLGNAVFAGGFAGSNMALPPVDAIISKCYSIGSVNGDTIFGGFLGWNNGTVEVSFWDKETSGLTSGVGTGSSSGFTGETRSAMQTAGTFTSAGWDFIWEDTNGSNDIWAICDGGDYPKLTWQFTIGDFDGDDDVDFADFASFAMHWREADSVYPCGGTDLTGDEQTGLDDLKQFTDNWVASVEQLF